MSKLKLLELFGGIGACSKALERLGIDYEVVDYVEIDKYAVKSFNAMHGTNFEPQDICKWDKDIKVDLIMHGSPCQDFSLAGKQQGGDEGSGTRSSLMYETLRIVDKLKPKYVIWENVKNVISKKHIHNFQSYLTRMRMLGYQNYYKVLNAKDYGIPQNRERVFVISIRSDVNSYGCHVFNYKFPEPIPLKLKLKDMLEDNVDEKYYLSEDSISKLCNGNINSNFVCKDGTYYGLYSQQSKRFIQNPVEDISLSMKANKYDASILIKNNTKKGYLEARYGDGVYTNISTTKRGTVQPQMIQTITTRQDLGVVIKNEN